MGRKFFAIFPDQYLEMKQCLKIFDFEFGIVRTPCTNRVKVCKEYAKIIDYCDYKYFNEQMFLRDLQNHLADFNLDKHDPNISWQIWKNKFFRIEYNHAPVNRRKFGTKRLPWLTTDLIHDKRHINFLHRKARTTTQLMPVLSTERQKNNSPGK